MLNPDQYKLNEAKHQSIFEQRIQSDLFSSVTPVNHPVAVILGGQPGAGKSVLVKKAMNQLALQGGSVQIDGDALRDYHPAYRRLMKEDDKIAAFYTDRDTGMWIEKAIAYAKEKRVNLVIEGTMRSPDVVAATMRSLREADYQIDARALAVPWCLSEQGIIQRYENQKVDRGRGRMTTPEAHKAAYDGMLDSLERIEREKLADRLTIYRRGADAIYFNVLKNGHWQYVPEARAAVEAERARPMTLVERKDYAKGFDDLHKLISKPERKAGSEEIQQIESLQYQANDSLQQAQTLASEQRALLESAPVEQTWTATLKQYVETKHEQIGRIETRMEQAVERQEAKLKQVESSPPKLKWYASQKTKAAAAKVWDNSKNKALSRLHCLQKRQSIVHKIKESTDSRYPTVEELATRKMRRDNPELAGSWDAMREAVRLKEQQARQEREKQHKQNQQQSQGQSQGLSHRLRPS